MTTALRAVSPHCEIIDHHAHPSKPAGVFQTAPYPTVSRSDPGFPMIGRAAALKHAFAPLRVAFAVFDRLCARAWTDFTRMEKRHSDEQRNTPEHFKSALHPKWSLLHALVRVPWRADEQQ